MKQINVQNIWRVDVNDFTLKKSMEVNGFPQYVPESDLLTGLAFAYRMKESYETAIADMRNALGLPQE